MKKLFETNLTRQRVIFSIVGLVAIVLICFTILKTWRHLAGVRKAVTQSIQPGSTLPNQNEINQKPIVLVESSLNGEKVDEAVVNRHPLAVVIENHPEARPQRGLSDASVVYETIAEGGITRFLAVFGPNSSVKVGPVRSARTYFVDWVLEYDGLFAHVGGSQEALDRLRQAGVKDLDQFGLGTRAYNREPEPGKATEHTMFTSTDKLWQAAKEIKKYDINTNSTSPLQWKEDEVADSRPKTQTITIQFSSDTYEVRWEYNHDSNTYNRILANTPHLDGNNSKQLRAKTIVVQEVIRENVPTEGDRTVWKMTTVGSGQVKIIQDGKIIDGTWKKLDQKSRTRFYDQDGNEFKLNRGVTWIEVVPPGTPILSANG